MDIGTQSATSVIYANITLECLENRYVEDIQRHSSTSMNM